MGDLWHIGKCSEWSNICRHRESHEQTQKARKVYNPYCNRYLGECYNENKWFLVE